jgi:hypothetical protein
VEKRPSRAWLRIGSKTSGGGGQDGAISSGRELQSAWLAEHILLPSHRCNEQRTAGAAQVFAGDHQSALGYSRALFTGAWQWRSDAHGLLIRRCYRCRFARLCCQDHHFPILDSGKTFDGNRADGNVVAARNPPTRRSKTFWFAIPLTPIESAPNKAVGRLSNQHSIHRHGPLSRCEHSKAANPTPRQD